MAALLLATGTGATSCKTRTTSGANKTASLTTDTLATTPVVYTHISSDSSLRCLIKAEIPMGTDALSKGVRNFIAKQLAQSYLPYSYCEESQLKDYPTYSGSPDNAKAMIDHYGNCTVKLLKAISKDINSTVTGQEKEAVYSEMKITKEAETKHYLTYCTTTYNELGGPHGSSTIEYSNISKVTNKVIEQVVDSTRIKELQPLLRKNLLKYFKEGGDLSITDQNINDALTLKDGLIPLPVTTPLLESDGVTFIYQQYEIGPYSMGMPNFTIPYSEIKPYLTPEVKKLL